MSAVYSGVPIRPVTDPAVGGQPAGSGQASPVDSFQEASPASGVASEGRGPPAPQRESSLWGNAPGKGVGLGSAAFEKVNALGDTLRNKVADRIGVARDIAGLETIGSSYFLGTVSQIGIGRARAGSAAELFVERTRDGYKLRISGETSTATIRSLALEEIAQLEGFKAKARRVTTELTFTGADSRVEVIRAAETLVGLAATVGTTAITAGDELAEIRSKVTKTTLEVELSAGARANFGGLTGLGLTASAGASVSNALAIDFIPNQRPELVLTQELAAHARLSLEDDLPLPVVGGTLEAGALAGSGNAQLVTRVPIPEIEVRRLLSDPVETVKSLATQVVDTAQSQIEVHLRVEPGTLVLSGPQGDNVGLKVDIIAGAKTRELVEALLRALGGDLTGALGQLDERVKVDALVDTFLSAGKRRGGTKSLGPFLIGAEATSELLHAERRWSFAGSPSGLLAEIYPLLSSLRFQILEG